MRGWRELGVDSRSRRTTLVTSLMLMLLLASFAHPVSVLAVGADEASDIEISPKISVKGPRARGGTKPGVAATGVLGEPPPSSHNKWAVVIGISDYDGTSNDIQYADDDALDILRALTEVYGYKRDHIRLLVSDYRSSNAGKSDIMSPINWLRDQEGPGDEVVFFYSGHGARGKANDGDAEAVDEAIVPYECTSRSLIWDGELGTMFSDFEAARIVFIFDSRYSGGMTDLKGNGRIVLMACSESALSYEGETLGNGQFTYYLVEEGVIEGLADSMSHDQLVAVEEAFDYAKANCVYQKPLISDSFENDLLL